MKLDTEIQFGKKKAVYPSKTTINLYYKEDRSSKISTLVIDGVFVLVLLLGILKFGFVDLIVARNNAADLLQKNQAHLEKQMVALKDYDEVTAEYNRYSYESIVENQPLWDRVEVLNLIEREVMANASVKSLNIIDNVVTVSFDISDMDKTAQMIRTLESYDGIIQSVQIGSHSGNMSSSSHSTSLVITLVDKNAGGAQ